MHTNETRVGAYPTFETHGMTLEFDLHVTAELLPGSSDPREIIASTVQRVNAALGVRARTLTASERDVLAVAPEPVHRCAWCERGISRPERAARWVHTETNSILCVGNDVHFAELAPRVIL